MCASQNTTRLSPLTAACEVVVRSTGSGVFCVTVGGADATSSHTSGIDCCGKHILGFFRSRGGSAILSHDCLIIGFSRCIRVGCCTLISSAHVCIRFLSQAHICQVAQLRTCKVTLRIFSRGSRYFFHSDGSALRCRGRSSLSLAVWSTVATSKSDRFATRQHFDTVPGPCAVPQHCRLRRRIRVRGCLAGLTQAFALRPPRATPVCSSLLLQLIGLGVHLGNLGYLSFLRVLRLVHASLFTH